MSAVAALQNAFRTLLVAANPVTSLVKDAIRLDTLQQGDKLPAIVVEVPEDNPVQTLGEGDRLEGTAVAQMVCCAHDRPKALAVASAVRAALADYEGSVGGIYLDEVTYDGVNRDYEPPEDLGDENAWYFEPLRFFVIYK